eukprot:400005-Rhodomonas_salina.1
MNLRLPLNNVLLAVGLTIFTGLVQIYWVRSSEGIGAADLPSGYKQLAASQQAAGAGPASQTSLQSLMYIDKKHAVTPLPEGYKGPVRGMYTFTSEVFTHKFRTHELLEAAFVESTIVVPLILMAVFSMCVPTAMDWVVQGLYLRMYLLLIFPALALKFVVVYVRHFQLQGKGGRSVDEIRAVLIVLLLTMGFLFVTFSYDFINPINQTMLTWDLDFHGHKKGIFYVGLIFLFTVGGIVPF